MRPLIVFHPEYRADIGAHVFPMEKYALTANRLKAELAAGSADWQEPEPAWLEDLQLVLTDEYLDDLRSVRLTERTMMSELPVTAEIVQAYVLATGGTILACRGALERGLAMNIGGGFHHAFADHAEGFCYINDIAVGIRVMVRDGRIRRAAVIDCDLHQGNGTACIFADDDSVFTFSIHQENLYPLKQKSDWDIGLDDPAGDDLYLRELQAAVPQILDRHEPELVVYQAGADPYEEDQLGNLGISLDGLRKRDRIVLTECARRSVPCAITLGGGYARKTEDTVTIHVNTGKVMIEAATSSPIPSA